MTDYGSKDRKAAEEAVVRLLHLTPPRRIKNVAAWVLGLRGTARAVIRAQETESPTYRRRLYPVVNDDLRDVKIEPDAVFEAFLAELRAPRDVTGPQCTTIPVEVNRMLKVLVRWVKAVPGREPTFATSVRALLAKYPLASALGDRADPVLSKWLACKANEDVEFARSLACSVAYGITERKDRLETGAVAASLALLLSRAHGLLDSKIFRPDLIGSPGAFSQGLDDLA